MPAQRPLESVIQKNKKLIEVAVVGWYQCLVCLRIVNDVRRFRCCSDYYREKLTLEIVRDYEAVALPPEIRHLLYPNYVEPPQNVASSRTPAVSSTSQLRQNGEPSPSTSKAGCSPLHSTAEEPLPAHPVSEAFTGRPNTSPCGVYKVEPRSPCNSPAPSTSSVSYPFTLPEGGPQSTETLELLSPAEDWEYPQDFDHLFCPRSETESLVDEEDHSHLDEDPSRSDQEDPSHSDEEDPSHSEEEDPSHSDEDDPSHSDHENPSRSYKEVEEIILDSDSSSFHSNSIDFCWEETAKPHATMTLIDPPLVWLSDSETSSEIPGDYFTSLPVRDPTPPRSIPQTGKGIASTPQIPASSHSKDLTTTNDPQPCFRKTTPPPSRRSQHRPPIPFSVKQHPNLQRNENRPNLRRKIYSQGSLPDDHLQSQIKKTPFECPHCGKGCSVQSSCGCPIKYDCLTRLEESSFSCPLCEKTFSTKYNMITHIPTHFSQPTIFHCSYCPATFKALTGLRTHTSALHAKNEYKCKRCGKIFSKGSSLREHMIRCPEKIKAHSCVHCKRRFVRKQELYEHLSSQRKERPYPCTKCDKSFQKSNQLQSHLQAAHSSKKRKAPQHSCIFCGKEFLLKTNLNSHLCVHIRERWYSCKICGTQFTTKGAMKQHGQRFHQK